MYDQNNIQSGGFDHESGIYHYTYNPTPRPEPFEEPKKPRKSRRGLKITALVLSCALVGGAAGVGGAAAYSSLSRDAVQAGAVTIYQNQTDPTAVELRQADGLNQMTLAEIYAAYADACVCITITTVVQSGFYQYEATGAGSGFIISEDGYIVTNYHVIEDAASITVTLNDGTQHTARLIGGEETNDVAVLKIDGITGLTCVVLGDSDDLVVGETVCTIGNALGALSFSQTSGGVSATNRAVSMSDGTVLNMIQTDCTINSGNSGGPLFDSYGRVVGITSAKYSNNGDSSSAAIEGIGFAIPINDVLSIITDYIQYGYVTGRPYMGITCADVTEQYQTVFGWPAGVYVNSVEEGSCAQTAGLKQGDIITAIDGTAITGTSQMISVKNGYTAGDTVTITLFRSGEYLTLSLTFDEQGAVSTSTESSGSSSSSSRPGMGGR